MLKKTICLLLASLFAISLVACTPDSGADGESDAPTEEILNYVSIASDGKEKYSIVLPEDASEALKQTATALSNTMQELSGKKPTRKTDNTKRYDEDKVEILLGVSEREAAKNAVNSLADGEYLIKYENGKLIISASSDILLADAVAELGAYLRMENGTLCVPDSLSIKKNVSDRLLPLTQGTKPSFTVIVAASASDKVYSAAYDMVNDLEKLLGGDVPMKIDTQVSVDASSYELLIGRTNREESTALYEAIGEFGYRAAVYGNKIAVGGATDNQTMTAIGKFLEDASDIVKGTHRENIMVKKDYLMQSENVAVEPPVMTAGGDGGVYEPGDNNRVIVRNNTTKSDFDAYLKQLTSVGFEKLNDYTLGENSYALFIGSDYDVYVSYIKPEKATRISITPKGFAYPEKSSSFVSTSTPTLWQLAVDVYNSKANGGMSYVFRAKDGSFIIIDGGYNTETEADNLYDHLIAQTGGKKPVISAWFITHLHGDHYGAMLAFSEKYASQVEVKGFYYNLPAKSTESTTENLNYTSLSSVNAAMKRFTGAVRYGKLHSGMQFDIGGIGFEVIYTHEDMYPDHFADGNDTSTVMRVTVGDQKLMILADAREGASGRMLSMFEGSTDDVLKSDIVQFAHHGYEGCTVDLYKAVGAHTVLWPMNIKGYQDNTDPHVFKNWLKRLEANKYVVESETVKKIIVAGAGTTEIVLPYTPTGSKLPDYEAIYDSITR